MDKTVIDKLALIYIKDRKVLVSLSRGKDTWYLPGGKREQGETDEMALKREVREELSVALAPKSISRYGAFEAQAHGMPAGTVVRMTCYMADIVGDIVPANEIEQVQFVGYRDNTKISDVDHLIFDNLYAKGLIK